MSCWLPCKIDPQELLKWNVWLYIPLVLCKTADTKYAQNMWVMSSLNLNSSVIAKRTHSLLSTLHNQILQYAVSITFDAIMFLYCFSLICSFKSLPSSLQGHLENFLVSDRVSPRFCEDQVPIPGILAYMLKSQIILVAISLGCVWFPEMWYLCCFYFLPPLDYVLLTKTLFCLLDELIQLWHCFINPCSLWS
jgi:hypothetical protein